MKIAIVHDDFMQWGGAERLVLALSEVYPQAPIFTALVDYRKLPFNFPVSRLQVSGLQKVFLFRSFYRPFFFLHPLVFEDFDFSSFDVVISSTTRFAKSIIVKPPTIHICYCNTPARFLWDPKSSFPLGSFSFLVQPLLSYLRGLDQISAQRVDYFLANSQNVAERINKFYRRTSRVVYPFANLERFTSTTAREKPITNDYYLIVSRLSSHKRVDLALEVFSDLGLPLKIIGGGPELKKYRRLVNKNVELLGPDLSDKEVSTYFLGCKAFIFPQEEDFGITAVEALAAGKPVIALARGGALEIIEDGKTGLFFYEQSKESLKEVISRFESLPLEKIKDWPENCRQRARQFSKERFCQEIDDFVKEKLNLAKIGYNNKYSSS